jgi:GNAT superfamily N-acetyltransferase
MKDTSSVTSPRPMNRNSNRALMRLVLGPNAVESEKPVRPPVKDDIPGLGRLMYQAYLGTVDYEGETEEEAVAELNKTWEGGYGEFNQGASWVYERNGQLLSATLVNIWRGKPFIVYCFTHPSNRNQGLATVCMQSAIAALATRGESEVQLIVTLTNWPAVRLYRRLGFEAQLQA